MKSLFDKASYTQATLVFTEAQATEHENMAKRVGANNLHGLIERSMILTKLIVSALDQGAEFVIIYPKDVEVMHNKEAKSLAIVGPATKIGFVTKMIKEAASYLEDIREWNKFGKPIDSMPC